jgi:hypothetical protein
MDTDSEPKMETPQEIIPERINRAPLYIALGVVVVILLTMAAFFAGRLMNQQADNPTGPQLIVGPGGAGSASAGIVSSRINVLPAPELPKTQPEINGVFTRRDDNSIYLGTSSGGGMGIISSSAGTSSDTGPSTNISGPAYDGPVVEVVTTADTKIYKETTQLEPPSSSKDETDQTLQQTVEPGSLDELNTDGMVTVWGTRTGDRIVADVILYSQPLMIMAPAP